MKTLVMMWLAAGGLAGCAESNGGQRPSGGVAEAVDVPPKLHGPKKRIAIVDFDDSSGFGGWGAGRNALAAAARDSATEALVKSGAFVVVEREQLEQIMKEQGLGMTGAITAQTAVQAGKLLGLQAIVTGKITDFAEENKQGGFGGYYSSQTRIAHARVSLRVIDATTGEVWMAESGEGAADEKSVQVLGGGNHSRDENLGKRALYLAIHQMVNKLLVKADSKPWAGSVAKVSKDGRLYITGGSDIGLLPGSVLEVRRQGEEITDPSTGQVIGRELGKMMGLITVASHLNEKLSICEVARGQGFSVGDSVTMAPAPPPSAPPPSAPLRQ